MSDLVKIRDFFAQGPHTFAQHAYALDANGSDVDSDDPSAVKFCIRGAYLHLSGNNTVWATIREKSQELYNHGPLDVNDNIGYDAVMNVLNAAVQ